MLLHEDPRYFRRGSGSTSSRVRYALTRVVMTRTDSGGTRFKLFGVARQRSAVGISNFYYPDSFSVTGTMTKLLMQVGTDATSQVLKECWPDIKAQNVVERVELASVIATLMTAWADSPRPKSRVAFRS